MWFKNLKVYRFSKPFGLQPDEIESLLAAKAFKPCGKTDRASTGWYMPVGDDASAFTHTVSGATMIRLREQSKILPAAAINEALKEKATAIERKEGRKLFRKERDQLKDEIIMDMLPRAFIRTKDTYAFFTQQYLIVNTGSSSAAEQLLHNLRQALDSLPVVLVHTKSIPIDVLTGWVQQGHGTEDFAIGEECELFNPREDGSLIRCKGQDLQSDEIQAHLQTGMCVKQLAVAWNDSVSCVIDRDLTVKRVKFGDVVTGKANEVDAESAEQQFDQDFAVMSGTVLQLINALVNALGGIDARNAN